MQPLTIKGFHFYEQDKKWYPRGVTYGPFKPGHTGIAYPHEKITRDFQQLRQLGVNALRLYEVPDEGVAEIAAEHGLRLLIDISWPKHIDVYDYRPHQEVCLKMLRQTIQTVKSWHNLIGLILSNEIPTDIVRWQGPQKVERFVKCLHDEAKNLAPEIFTGFANYPPTEYLQLNFLDFIGFNVYLHEPDIFRPYLIRLRHLFPEKPLLLSEYGIDTQEHGEELQSHCLESNLAIAYEVGVAGTFVFAYTDEWHTGGFDITKWSFGLTTTDRQPKSAWDRVREVYQCAPRTIKLADFPKISVVVAVYNSARTLRKCLTALQQLNYSNYEVIVVDDGSTDNTQEILADFPRCSVISQPNRGLSVARNAGIAAASGEFVAFTDGDCYVDPDWLYYLAVSFERESVAGLGGPNLTVEQPTYADRCIAFAPGHATHVMLDDTRAEHIPGCNMAFRKSTLVELGGFDPVFRKAGDDVDLVWRLQDWGYQIGFTTAGFVWHHRRHTFCEYFRQQAGYGEAEYLLLKKHPHRFNDRGQSMWKGAIYSSSGMSPWWSPRHIFFGVFGSASFQCIYHQSSAVGAWHLLSSFEWWVISCMLLVFGLVAQPALMLGVGMVGVSLVVGINNGVQRWLTSNKQSAALLPAICFLWIMQPIIRGVMRYAYRLRATPTTPQFQAALKNSVRLENATSPARRTVLEFWHEQGPTRLKVIRQIADQMLQQGWPAIPNTGWEAWDLTVPVSLWFKVQLRSVQEHHGAEKVLLRLKFQLVPSGLLALLVCALCLGAGMVALHNTVIARLLIVTFLFGLWWLYRHAGRGRELVKGICALILTDMGYLPLYECTGKLKEVMSELLLPMLPYSEKINIEEQG